ncbi:MAG: DEAD/DEAH box helicase [Burkholderiales bacterium]
MPAFALKSYQKQALAVLSDFLTAASRVGAASAFQQQVGRAYRTEPFGEIPCVCLRIPTGGGKTLTASHAIVTMARDWRATDAPVVVWLVPSETIRAQTIGALQTPGHPYRNPLEETYGQRFEVCDLERVSTLAPNDWGRHAIVVVATIQSFRVEQTDIRNVYAFSESFERHFKSVSAERLTSLAGIPDAVVRAEDAAEPESPLRPYVGQARFSLANWLALHSPLVIVDEAHNTRTEQSFAALKRLNPSAILELTATPVAQSTNVLYHVSAQELQAEEMIKLPITLREHPEGWQAAVFGALQTQKWLETEAKKAQAAGDAYVRPIVLFQAQNVNDEVPPIKLKQYLIEELHVPEEQIAIATGDTRELAGKDLSDVGSPIRFIITVQALREGWDCPFAYILCSLQSLSSATAVEQLLGRVLRMPYASRRSRDTLNRAYAHVCEVDFAHAANALVDRLVSGMGFEALDVASMIAPQSELFTPPDQAVAPPAPPVSTVVELSIGSGLEHVSGVTLSPGQKGKGVRATLTGHVDDVTEKLLLSNERSEKKREQIRERITQHNAIVAAQGSPSMRGIYFAPIPPLGYRPSVDAPLLPLEREAVLENNPPDLLAQPISLLGFQVVESDNAFEIFLDQQRVRMRAADPQQLALDAVETGITEEDLIRWLDRELRQPAIGQAELRPFLAATVSYLVNEQRVPLNTLARMRFVLARQIGARIADLRQQQASARFKQLVLDGEWSLGLDEVRAFKFEGGRYPVAAAQHYRGRWQFKKHYFPVVANLKESGEEFDCARTIDNHLSVKHWVRNLETEPFGFWFPTSRGRFFPDFVCELLDGRLVVVEYKGAHLRNDPYEIEKRQVGRIWQERGDGKYRFDFVFLTEGGKNVRQQLDALFGGI